MKEWHVEVSWRVDAVLNIVAKTKEEAIARANEIMDKEELPQNASYSKGSYEIEYIADITDIHN